MTTSGDGSACSKEATAAPAKQVGDQPAKRSEPRAIAEMSLDEVEARLKDPSKGKLHLFDNNTKDRWEKGHVPTAKWVAFNDVKAGDLPPEKDATLVFYCANEH